MSLSITLEVQEVQAILSSIAKQPFEQVADLWFKIKGQAEQQLAAQQQVAQQPTAEEAKPEAAEGEIQA